MKQDIINWKSIPLIPEKTEQVEKMRDSQKEIFWRNHLIREVIKKGKVVGWCGRRFPKTAQDIIEEVEND